MWRYFICTGIDIKQIFYTGIPWNTSTRIDTCTLSHHSALQSVEQLLCREFINGIVRVRHSLSLNLYLILCICTLVTWEYVKVFICAGQIATMIVSYTMIFVKYHTVLKSFVYIHCPALLHILIPIWILALQYLM